MVSDYWKKRVEAEMEERLRSTETIAGQMKSLHAYYFDNIQKEIESFYQRYADKNGLSKSEAKQRVSEFDVTAFSDKAARYVREKDFSAQANSELSLYNLKMKVSRLEILQYHLDLEMVALANEEENITKRFLQDGYMEEVQFQAGILADTVASPKQLGNVAEAIINAPFKGATWSEKIWTRQNTLRTILQEEIRGAILKGRNPIELIPKLRKEFEVSYQQARRLAITEYARVQSEVQKASMKANGFEKYVYLAESRACRICASKDDKIFLVDEMTPGKNCAPMHPHCRCSTAPVVDKTVENFSNKLYNQSVINLLQPSGSISKARGDVEKQKEDFASRYYSQLKNSDRQSIVEKMVESSHLPEETVSSALAHVLDNEYMLWDFEAVELRSRNFYPDYDMAQSFQRLYLGNPKEYDIVMLQHESLEAYYMNVLKMDYDDAHKLANAQFNYEEVEKHGKN